MAWDKNRGTRPTDANYRRGRSGRPLQRAKERVYATETHCCRCGEEVDKTLPYRDPITGRVNLWSKSFDHTQELASGADPYQGHLAHVGCNIRAGARYGRAQQTGNTHPGTDTSADWR